MIELDVMNFLTERTGYPAFLEEPDKAHRPGSYYLAEKLGSSENDHITSAQIAVQSYAPSLVEAMSLNHAAKAAMSGFIELDRISRCRCVSDYNFTDTQTKRYRYQAVFDITYYEE
ncbi:MAG: hypothetical protein IJB19_04440 [Clostridia bacterium]|nr:hypothetical protein [Clostridia bacterium]